MAKKIYLCGPVKDCEETQVKDWRTRAKERLAGRFILLDPMRRNLNKRLLRSGRGRAARRHQ